MPSWELMLSSPVIIAVVGIFTVLAQRDRRKSRKSLAMIEEQVANDHASNLRVDIDRIESKVDQLVSKVDALADVQTRHLVAADEAKTAQDRRTQQIVERVSDISSRVRRIETRGEDS